MNENRWKKWTEEEDDLLYALWDSGASKVRMMKLLHRTYNAVVNRIVKKGWKR